MDAGLTALGGGATRTGGAARETDNAAGASAQGGGGTPFGEVMQAQGKPVATAGADPAEAAAAASPSLEDQAGASAAPAATPAGTADEDAPVIDGECVETLLALCPPPAALVAVGESGLAEPATAAVEPGAPVPAAGTLPALTPPAMPQHASATLRAALGRGEAPAGLAGLAGLEAAATETTAAAASLAGGATLPSAEGEDATAGGASDLPSGSGLGEARAASRTGSSEAAAAPSRPPELRAPPGTPAWTDELGTRLTWMLERGEQVASLRLTPENLGPLEVRIAVREGETTVWFGAAHADTRAALEQSLPRLKELLGASGLALANAGVFGEAPRDPQRGFTAAALARAARESGAEPLAATVTAVTRHGLVDLYA